MREGGGGDVGRTPAAVGGTRPGREVTACRTRAGHGDGLAPCRVLLRGFPRLLIGSGKYKTLINILFFYNT